MKLPTCFKSHRGHMNHLCYIIMCFLINVSNLATDCNVNQDEKNVCIFLLSVSSNGYAEVFIKSFYSCKMLHFAHAFTSD